MNSKILKKVIIAKSLLLLLLLFLPFTLHPDKNPQDSSTFTTHETTHENGDRTLTYEHEGSNSSGTYHYSATFEHDFFDTCERVHLSNFTVGYTPYNQQDQQTTPQINHEVQPPQANQQPDHCQENSDTTSQSNSCESLDLPSHQELGKNRALDNYFDNQVAQEKNNSTIPSHKSIKDIYDKEEQKSPHQRTQFYLWCKGIKEIFIGPSKQARQAKAKRYQEQDIKDQRTRALQKQVIEQRNQQLKNDLEFACDEHQIACASSSDPDFLKIMHQRDLPFELSLEKIQETTQKFTLKNSIIGLLQAYNIDTRQFRQLNGLAIQHHLTAELISNLNSIADLADANFSNQQLSPLIKVSLLVTDLAQNYNKNHQLLDAIAATNCSHGFVHYLQGMTLQTIDRCQKMVTALSFFNCEVAKYSLAAARGFANGVISSEITSVLLTSSGNLAYALAPQLTASVYAGATTIIVPIALTAGTLCSLAILGEIGNCGYLYATDQVEKLKAEYQRIENFAGQFYNFDQAPASHVENITTLATTLMWPWQREPIFNSLIGIKKAHCNFYFNQNNTVHRSQNITQNQLHEALEFIKKPELTKFNIEFKEIFGEYIFDFFPKNNPELAIAGMNNVINSQEQAALSQLILQQESSTTGNILKAGVSQILSDEISELSLFTTTQVGIKMQQAAKKEYEKIMLKNISKEYDKLIENKACQEVIDTFCKCHELSIVPGNILQDIERLHLVFKDQYLGLPEFSAENPYLTMQMRHIFYPNLQPKLNVSNQMLEKINLNGFHHDEYGSLEKSGILQWKNKIYGKAEFGAEGCFKADSYWDGEIICEEKTFFPSDWSREKTAQVIFKAAQNRIKEIVIKNSSQKKFECCGLNNLIIEIVFNKQNTIISAYPSMRNFKK